MSFGKKVVVAMSGGVDSSVAAYLLKNDGYDVIGITMKIWENEGIEKENGCCSYSAVYDARRVADHIGIPHYVLNFKRDFKEKVIDYFVDEYLKGKTPNPCIACNRYIKFDVLLNKAEQLGADFVATGHYAKIMFDESRNRYIIKKGNDPGKDQSYTLYNLTQEQLSKILMPLGYYYKSEIREIAKKIGLKVHNKPDSQEICFIPNDDYKEFLKQYTNAEIKPGPILDTRGNVVGKHKGIPYYTIGQRRGLGVALGRPVYVKEILPEKNTIIVGYEEEVKERGLIANRVNLVAVESIKGKMRVNSRIRYNAKETPSTIEQASPNKVKVMFQEPQKGVAPGQSVVFYKDDIVIGGGIIESSL